MAPMRFPSFLIPLLLSLILVQGGSHAHVIAHLGEQAGASLGSHQRTAPDTAQDEPEHPHERVCMECLALCGIDLPLAASAAALPVALAGNAPVAGPTVAGHRSAGLRPRCRAPPTQA